MATKPCAAAEARPPNTRRSGLDRNDCSIAAMMHCACSSLRGESAQSLGMQAESCRIRFEVTRIRAKFGRTLAKFGRSLPPGLGDCEQHWPESGQDWPGVDGYRGGSDQIWTKSAQMWPRFDHMWRCRPKNWTIAAETGPRLAKFSQTCRTWTASGQSRLKSSIFVRHRHISSSLGQQIPKSSHIWSSPPEIWSNSG